jgi:hypothetical protein
MAVLKKFLKKIIIGAVIFDIVMLVCEFRTIQFGAFCLGMKTSEIVYDQAIRMDPK